MKQKVLITGNGQVANELVDSMPKECDILHCGRDKLDISQANQCLDVIGGYKPQWVINAAAYTAVDKAESDIETAYLVNQQGVANLANATKSVDARLIHISTDFVFDGNGCRPYREEDQTDPIGVYGASKLAGEKILSETMSNAITIRTSWVYSQYGGNFVKTMLRLMQSKERLGVIVDQIGTPTWARGIAEIIWLMVLQGSPGGLYHWSDAGVCSWYDFAVAIQKRGLELGLLEKAIPIEPIPTSAYPTPAARPNYSVMDKSKIIASTGVEQRHWQVQLDQMLSQLKA